IFGASGTLAGTGDTPNPIHATLRVDGRSAGVDKPIATDFQLHMQWAVVPHLVVGGVMGLFGGDGDVAPRPLPIAVSSSYSGFRFGPEIGTVFTREWFELRATVALGYLSASLPVTGFEKVPCKGGRCYPSAIANELFIEPRLSIAARPCTDTRRFCAG